MPRGPPEPCLLGVTFNHSSRPHGGAKKNTMRRRKKKQGTFRPPVLIPELEPDYQERLLEERARQKRLAEAMQPAGTRPVPQGEQNA
jgi:hypothetical protein